MATLKNPWMVQDTGIGRRQVTRVGAGHTAAENFSTLSPWTGQETRVRCNKGPGAAIGALLFASGIAAGAVFSDALDAAKAAPHIYRTVLDNERLRVLDVTVRNGEMAPLHSHPDRLIVFLNACAWLEVTGDGERRMQSFTTGDIVWEPGMMHGGEPANVVHDCRQLEIELKDP